ncbi:hypothetical protein ABZZ74_53300 [Streptomyces sp. NPDC006476]|uniref:hypothetical protein n=1 Tax=Streptomyces sp. NPDC006476 TaxID=3157175 RepID=UPI0033BCE657
MALSVLDEHIARGPGGPASTFNDRQKRRRRGLPNYQLIRYADDCAYPLLRRINRMLVGWACQKYNDYAAGRSGRENY